MAVGWSVASRTRRKHQVVQPPKPSNEAARLQALRSYNVLDTPPETAFDALTRIAAALLGTPTALVSLIDDDRQWFKARCGLDVTETPRDLSFCRYVVADDRTLVVEDALADPRFADNPLVAESPKIRFYAGVPLRTSEGYVLGTLCAIDYVPRTISAEDLQLLESLAEQVMSQLEYRRQSSLIHREELLHLVLDRLPRTAVLVFDHTGTVLQGYGNLQLVQGEPTGAPLTAWADLAYREQMERAAEACLDGVAAAVEVVVGPRRLSVDLVPVPVVAGTLGLAVVSDVTERDRIALQERLVTTGTLAAGIGHEINNPLFYIIGNLDFALEGIREIATASRHSAMPAVIDGLGDAREGAERIRKIVGGLRAFARGPGEVGPVEVSSAITMSIQMAMHELRHSATLVTDLQPVPCIYADESRLSQVLVNLLVNAGQAFKHNNPDRNRVAISTRLRDDGRVEIQVSDNGPGIAPQMLERIFDPFFTTKPQGLGTGLGLSVSLNIVESMGGELHCESTETGSTFKVLLGAVPEGPADQVGCAPPVRKRLLIVDDDAAILRTIARVFAADYEVVTSADPREALRRLREGEAFDVVVCDVMMPHFSGIELYLGIEQSRPDLAERFVFATGGARTAAMQEFLDQSCNPTLHKPFEIDALRSIVRQMVAASDD